MIARALALQPKLLVCDEPTASLDVSIRAQIVNLLVDLKERLNLAMLYISHDLRTVQALSDRILVMYLGRHRRGDPPRAIDARACSTPYAAALVAAIPVLPTPSSPHEAPKALGEVPSAITPPSGCAYHPRCVLARGVCAEDRPVLTDTGQGRRVACHAVAGPAHDRWLTDEVGSAAPSPLPISPRL